ncbi:MAG: glycosyltransferase family 2 protein [Nitrososphaerales archaeon]
MKPAPTVLAVLAMAVLLLALFVMNNVDVYVAAGCAAIGVVYLALIARSSVARSQAEIKPKRQFPALLFIVLIIPLIASISLGALGFLGTPFLATLRTLIISGFSITFFFISFSIPLALSESSSKKEFDPAYHPLVSILVAAYNEELVIARTLQSLVNIPYDRKEIIVIDDGSKDKTNAIASWYRQFGVKVLRKENGGKARALNYGLLFSQGEIIVTVDADSVLHRDAVDEIVKLMSNKKIYAAAGNVKALNANSMITHFQELEYITAINTLRRSLDRFGAIAVVPGAFGVFRKEAIDNTGGYDPDTVAEDFDLTLKIQKAYGCVGASSTAIAYTEVPANLHNLYKQRYRWAKGTYQALIKHRDAFLNQRFGVLHSIIFPILLLSMIVPFATFGAIIAGIILTLNGGFELFLFLISLFVLIQFLISVLALSLDNTRLSLAWYAPFLAWGYRQFLDVIMIYSLLSLAFSSNKRSGWNRVDRVGGLQREVITERKHD